MSAALIYFMKPLGYLGPIKIGCSKWPANRLVSIGHVSPIPLEIICSAPGDFKLEHFLHTTFRHAHSHLEWFHPDPALMAGIERVKCGQSVMEAFGIAVRLRKRWGVDSPVYLADDGDPSQSHATHRDHPSFTQATPASAA
jgi:hypothetical protein